MSTHRLHIDIPLPMSEADAVAITQIVMASLQAPHLLQELHSRGVPSINYRLGHDEDRQRSNYLEKTPSGHVTCNKSRITIIEESHED